MYESSNGFGGESTTDPLPPESDGSTVKQSTLGLTLKENEVSSNSKNDGLSGLNMLCELNGEELEHRTQQIAIALQTDAQTLQLRLELRQQHRDLAERNFELEIDKLKSALQKLQYIYFDRESLEVVNSLQSQLDCVRSAVAMMVSTAEAYGFTQSEERIAPSLVPLLRYIDSISRNVDRHRHHHQQNTSHNRRQSHFSEYDDINDENKIMRRRSVAVLPCTPMEHRRRASISYVPPIPIPSTTNNNTMSTLSLPPDCDGLRLRRHSRVMDSSVNEIRESPERVMSPPVAVPETITSLVKVEPADFYVNRSAQLIFVFGLLLIALLFWSLHEYEYREFPL